MTTEILVSLIALAGVLISVVVSVFINSRQTANELAKLRTEIQQEFSRRLFEKRLEAYPKLYFHLSKFIKIIQFEIITHQAVQELFENFQDWDNQNGFLFSGYAGRVSYDIRKLLSNLTKLSDNELKEKYATSDALVNLRHEIQTLELAIKNELGIYAYESPTNIKEIKLLKSYRDVTNTFFPEKNSKTK